MSKQTIIIIGAGISGSMMARIYAQYPNDKLIVVNDINEANTKARELGIAELSEECFQRSKDNIANLIAESVKSIDKLNYSVELNKPSNPWPTPHPSKNRPHTRFNNKKR